MRKINDGFEIIQRELRFNTVEKRSVDEIIFQKYIQENTSKQHESKLQQHITERKICYIFAYMNIICFGLKRKPQKISGNSIKKMKEEMTEYRFFSNFHHQNSCFLSDLETNVLLQKKTLENLIKFMQTREPFLIDVGYNILGEGQQFVDEKIGYAYNVVKCLASMIIELHNFMNRNDCIYEGAAICR